MRRHPRAALRCDTPPRHGSRAQGLCGGVNSSVVKATKAMVSRAKEAGESTQLFIVGSKARDALVRDFSPLLVANVDEIYQKPFSWAQAAVLADQVLKSDFDKLSIIYNKFYSVVRFEVTPLHLGTPALLAETDKLDAYEVDEEVCARAARRVAQHARLASRPPPRAPHPTPRDPRDPPRAQEDAEMMADLFQFELASRLFNCVLENSTSENASRMTAMDNASKNAKDMITKLQVVYNRQRQAVITTELNEIISGAESL